MVEYHRYMYTCITLNGLISANTLTHTCTCTCTRTCACVYVHLIPVENFDLVILAIFQCIFSQYLHISEHEVFLYSTSQCVTSQFRLTLYYYFCFCLRFFLACFRIVCSTLRFQKYFHSLLFTDVTFYCLFFVFLKL